MPSFSLLIVDDEPQIRRAVRNALEGDASRILEAGTAKLGIDLIAAERPDLVVLDLGLPDADGTSVCREVRVWSTVPIIVLSARHSDQEKVALLELGADDYVIKPFSPEELRARVRVQLRRARAAPLETATFLAEGLEIDIQQRSLRRDGREVHLTPTEWDILRALLVHRGRTLTHDQLFRMVWNQPAGDPQAYLRVHVANIRRKIERDTLHPIHVLTEPGVGYRFATGSVADTRPGQGARHGSTPEA
jgi:Response regulators consisting of a CheY-like receiver domain and a winged-helix DNA-binding domain